MNDRLAMFFGQSRLGRKLTTIIHPRIHPGWAHPLRFQGGGCLLCNIMTKALIQRMPPVMDQSSIKVSEPEYAEDGTLIRRGVYMSATALRQLEALAEKDPAAREKIQKAMDEIAEHPETEK